MNSENQRRVSSRRANDEFLRRMLDKEDARGSRAVMNPTPMPTPSLPPERPNRPSCDGSYPNGSGNAGDCRMREGMPSLAMVYAPKQCWQNLLDPMTGLGQGSIFAELILPFQGCGKCREEEVGPRNRCGGARYDERK